MFKTPKISTTTRKVQKWAKDLNNYFSKDNIQIANKGMKRCSTSLVIGECKQKPQCSTTLHLLGCL